jgi:MoaA/NifB/PqqE/SkfB family radical SAM enzyme
VTQTSTSIQRAVLSLGVECDNACVFCAQAGLDPDRSPAADPRAALATLRTTHEEITFVGGEPSLDPRLPELVATAAKLGFSAIGVQTNARQLATDTQRFDELVATGLTDLHLSIHGANAAAHDFHSDRPGSLAASLELMARAQRAGLTVVVTTVITRSNFRELPKLGPALKRRGVAGWLLEVVRPYGRAADQFARVVPRFGMAIPWALLALEQARRSDLPAWIRGAPTCTLGPYASAALPESPDPTGALRDHPQPCLECRTRPGCPGVDRAYLEVFGSQELKARDAPAPARFDEARGRLMRMFVGVGPLVERPPQLYSDETVGKNRRLPILAQTPEAASGLAQSDPE